MEWSVLVAGQVKYVACWEEGAWLLPPREVKSGWAGTGAGVKKDVAKATEIPQLDGEFPKCNALAFWVNIN